MSLQPLPEDFLFNKIPEGVQNLDSRGVLQALCGGYQDRLEDLRSYVKKYEQLLDPTAPFPETSDNVIFATYTSSQGRTVIRTLTVDSSTPKLPEGTVPGSGPWKLWYGNVAEWAAERMGMSSDLLTSVSLGTDFLRAVDADIIQYLASTFGTVLYQTNKSKLRASEQRRIVAGYFPRLKIKGTSQSFEVLGRLMNFGEVKLTPLWGRLTPRLPNDVGSPANDKDFKFSPDIEPTVAVSTPEDIQPYDPFDYTDGGELFGWPAVQNGTDWTFGSYATLSTSRNTQSFYPTAVNGYNPFVKIFVSETGTVSHPKAGTAYVLSGGANHRKASVELVQGPTEINTDALRSLPLSSALHAVAGKGAVIYGGVNYAQDSIFTGASGIEVGTASGSVEVYAVTDSGNDTSKSYVVTNQFTGVVGKTYAVITGNVIARDSSGNVVAHSVVSDSLGNEIPTIPVQVGETYTIQSGSGSANDYATYNGVDIGGRSGSSGPLYLGLRVAGIKQGFKYAVVGTGVVLYNGVCYAASSRFTGNGGIFSRVFNVGGADADSSDLSVTSNPDGARMWAEAIAEGPGFNGVTLTTGALGQLRIEPYYLSAVKYRTSYYNLSLTIDFEKFVKAYGASAVTKNKNLAENPSLCSDGTAQAPFRPWTGVRPRVQASPANKDVQIDMAKLSEIGLQSTQHFEEVRAATRAPRRLSFGFSLADNVIYAPFPNKTTLATYAEGDEMTGNGDALAISPNPPEPPYSASLVLLCADGETQVAATGETDPNDQHTINYTATVIDKLGVTRGFTATFRFPSGDSGADSVTTPIPINTFKYSWSGDVAVGQQIIAKWIPETPDKLRPEPTNALKEQDLVGYQGRPEDEQDPTEGQYAQNEDGSVLSSLCAGGDMVDLDTYLPDKPDASLRAETSKLTVLDQSGVEFDVIGHDIMSQTQSRPIRISLAPRVPNGSGEYIQGRTAVGVMGDKLYHIGSVNGVLVGDPSKFYSKTHTEGLVCWIPFNRHPEETADIADISPTKSKQDLIGTIARSDRPWDSNRGWYTKLNSGVSLVSSAGKDISGAFTLAVWIKPGPVGANSTIIEVGSARTPSGYILPGVPYAAMGGTVRYAGKDYTGGFVGIDGITEYQAVGAAYVIKVSAMVSPNIPVVSATTNGSSIQWWVKGANGVLALLPTALPLTAGQFNFATLTITPTSAGYAGVTASVGASQASYPSVSYIGFSGDDTFTRISGSSTGFGIHDLRMWGVVKTSAQLASLLSPKLRDTKVVQAVPYFETLVRKEKWRIEVLPSGFAFPTSNAVAPFPHLKNVDVATTATCQLASPVTPGSVVVRQGSNTITDVPNAGNETGTIGLSGLVTGGTINYYTGELTLNSSEKTRVTVEYVKKSTTSGADRRGRAIRYLGSGRYYGSDLKREVGIGGGQGLPASSWRLGTRMCDVPASGKLVTTPINPCASHVWTRGNDGFVYKIGAENGVCTATVSRYLRSQREIFLAHSATQEEMNNLAVAAYRTPPAEYFGDTGNLITVAKRIGSVVPGEQQFLDTSGLPQIATGLGEVSVEFSQIDCILEPGSDVILITQGAAGLKNPPAVEDKYGFVGSVKQVSAPALGRYKVIVSLTGLSSDKVNPSGRGVYPKDSTWELRYMDNKVVGTPSAGIMIDDDHSFDDARTDGEYTSPVGARRPAYLYSTQRSVCSIVGKDVYYSWDDPESEFTGQDLPYATRDDAGLLSFTFNTDIPKGSYAVEIDAGNVGRPDPGFDGFAVELSIGDAVVVGKLLPGSLNYRATTTLEFTLNAALTKPWSLVVNWTNDRDFPEKGFKRQIAIYAIRIFERTVRMYQVSPANGTLTEVAITPSIASTPGGVMATIGMDGSATSYSHEGTDYPNPGYPSALLITGSTFERREHIKSESAASYQADSSPAAPTAQTPTHS